ncbi:hypothetical protein ACFO6V_03610 [Promicromonospora alba]|uniref:Uncharacterized protein n=1 Tax=Promicromonospora alba TaxID=1616110 RepID=A0ABV9HET6_9MICO
MSTSMPTADFGEERQQGADLDGGQLERGRLERGRLERGDFGAGDFGPSHPAYRDFGPLL